MRRSPALALLLLLSCTEQQAPAPDAEDTPVPSPTQEVQPPPTATVRLVAGDDPGLQSYEEGLRFAAEEVNATGNINLVIRDAPSVSAAVGLNPAAVIVIGDSASVAEERPTIEGAQTPVILMGGDLYSSRQLFRYAFQTSIPIRWQARVFATYLVKDRQHTRTAVLTTTDDSASTEPFNAAWTEEGAALETIASVDPDSSLELEQFNGMDSVVFVGSATDAALVSEGLRRLDDPPQLALSSDALDVAFATHIPRPGTVTCYAYTWSGWAGMLPRVREFRESFTRSTQHFPASLEQEGYDATKALAAALVRTQGQGGDRLVQELETFRDETYSSVPVRLSPDDHVLAEQSHLGLFAIEEPVDGGLPLPEASSLIPWRPILRTFTTDGEKVNFLDRDKRIFFPFWRPKRPTPKYWRSQYGIVSRPSDPLH